MGWIKSEKWPEPFVSVLLNCDDKKIGKHSYTLGWHNGIIYVNELDATLTNVSEWHKLPNPPIRDNKLVCKKSTS